MRNPGEHSREVRDAIHTALSLPEPSRSGKGRRWYRIAQLLARELSALDADALRLITTQRARIAELEAEIRDLRSLAVPQQVEVIRCYVSQKVIFESENAARRNARKKSDRLRVYLCPDCHGWHLTSQIGA